ncbi:MAG TPA: tetratricopeptide repeat protein [Candidatus Saccharimonadales bacterium]|nr:tetratricopeptide repeat protein [Candidatus Saccharimonadales bacterium]
MSKHKLITIGLVIILVAIASVIAWPLYRDRNLVKTKDVNLTPEAQAIYQQRESDAQKQISELKDNDDDGLFIAYLSLARAQFSLGQLNDAKKSYQKAIQTGASQNYLVANAWYELSTVLKAMNDSAGAKAALDKAISMDPHNDTFLNARSAN